MRCSTHCRNHPALSQRQIASAGRMCSCARVRPRRAASELLTDAVAGRPADPQLRVALATLTLRQKDAAAAEKILAAAPPEAASAVPLLLFSAQLAAGSADDDRAKPGSPTSRPGPQNCPTKKPLRLLSGLASLQLGAGNRKAEAGCWTLLGEKLPTTCRCRGRRSMNWPATKGTRKKRPPWRPRSAGWPAHTSPLARLASAGAKILRVPSAQTKKFRTERDEAGILRGGAEPAGRGPQPAHRSGERSAGLESGSADVRGGRGPAWRRAGCHRTASRAVKLGPAESPPPWSGSLFSLLYASDRLAEAQEALAAVGCQTASRRRAGFPPRWKCGPASSTRPSPGGAERVARIRPTRTRSLVARPGAWSVPARRSERRRCSRKPSGCRPRSPRHRLRTDPAHQLSASHAGGGRPMVVPSTGRRMPSRNHNAQVVLAARGRDDGRCSGRRAGLRRSRGCGATPWMWPAAARRSSSAAGGSAPPAMRWTR